MKILITFTFLFIIHINTFCQPFYRISEADSLINAITELQTKENGFYSIGQFPSQRGRCKRKEDNTIFFSSLIAFTLKGIQEQFEPLQAKKIDSICKQVRMNYIDYQNTSGVKTYNFWRTNPAGFFPNSTLLSHCSAFHLPDDADCTSMIYLTDSSLASETAWLHQKLTEHANESKLRIKNTFRRYQHFKAYSTWFGKQMPIEFDICVQSNILYFIYQKHLPLTVQDRDCIALLHEQIVSGDYIRYAYYLSPSYKKPAIVLYHLARLLEKNEIEELKDCREIIKKDIESELLKTKVLMEKILLSTALIRMSGSPAPIMLTSSMCQSVTNYAFFRANLFSTYARPTLRFIAKTNLYDRNFYCKAYSLALLAEYQILKSSKP